MKSYYVDFLELDEFTQEAVHLYLAQVLEFPEYYGKNLDALHDCLMEKKDCEIHIVHAEDLANYGTGGFANRLFRVFEEAASENPGLRLIYEEDDYTDGTSE